MYSSKDNPTNKKIYSLLDDIEEKISRFNNSRTYFNNSEEYIRKIINEEFNNLITSNQYIYDKINLLDNKINNISDNFFNEINNIKNQPMNIEKNIKNNIINLVENAFNELKKSLNQYIPYDEYIQKNESFAKQINNIKNNMMLDNNNLNKKMNELNLSLEDIKNKLNIFSNNYNNDMTLLKQNNNKISSNEININDLIFKNSFSQKKLEEQYKEINDLKNQIIKINSTQKYLEKSLKEKNDDKNINDIRLNLKKAIDINNIMSENINKLNSDIDGIRQKLTKLEKVKNEEILEFENETKKLYDQLNERINKIRQDCVKDDNSIINFNNGINNNKINEMENQMKNLQADYFELINMKEQVEENKKDISDMHRRRISSYNIKSSFSTYIVQNSNFNNINNEMKYLYNVNRINESDVGSLKSENNIDSSFDNSYKNSIFIVQKSDNAIIYNNNDNIINNIDNNNNNQNNNINVENNNNLNNRNNENIEDMNRNNNENNQPRQPRGETPRGNSFGE